MSGVFLPWVTAYTTHEGNNSVSGDTFITIGFAMLAVCFIISLLYGLGFFEE